VDADRTVREPAPAADPDSPFVYSLEGLAPPETPGALAARTSAPAWNSASGLHKLQEEVGGALHGGSSGTRLLDGPGEVAPHPEIPVPDAFAPRDDQFLLVPAYHHFGSDDLSMYAPGVAERAPAPYVGLNDADATRLGLHPGDLVALWLPWLDLRAGYRAMPSLPRGVAALPAGLPGMPFVALPAWARLARADEAATEPAATQEDAQ
jgi:NADH-quinone oxidoreductase subunit G